MTSILQARPIASAPRSDRMNSFFWLWLPLLSLGALIWGSWQGGEYYDRIFNNEKTGLMELGQALVMIAAFCVALATLPAVIRSRAPLWIYAWVAIAALGSLYVAGEEISWGQHLFHWATPDYWASINDQDETNLHNTSAWLDQKPRHLLSLGVIVGGVIVPLLALFRPEIREGRFGIILPPFLCFPSAVLACLLGLAALADSLGFYHGFSLVIRPSEAQENYFYSFVLLYLVVLRRRLRRAETAGLQQDD